jgi:hypothetical protein
MLPLHDRDEHTRFSEPPGTWRLTALKEETLSVFYEALERNDGHCTREILVQTFNSDIETIERIISAAMGVFQHTNEPHDSTSRTSRR